MRTPRREFSAATKRAAWKRSGGRCEAWVKLGRFAEVRCLAPVDIGCFIYEHINPVWMCDDASLENCGVYCLPCAKAKTRIDIKNIAKSKRIIRGKRKSKRPIRGWRKFDGTPVRAS